MIAKPVVFISSTSDLRSARNLVGKVLYSMGYEPIWQDIEATDGGELLDILRKRIEPCQMMIQLVGDRYGAEPPYPSPEFGRVSYTQFEAMYAEKLGRKVVYHFLTGQFPTDSVSAEKDEVRQLQADYRDRIIKINRLHQANITSPQDLELSVHRIRDELNQVRKEGDRRTRRLMAIAVASLIGILALGSLVAYVIHGQSHLAAKFDQMTARLDESEGLIQQFLAERPVDANGQPIIPQLKGDLLTRAEEMIAKGNRRQRLEAAVAINDFATADRLQSEIRAQNKADRDTEDFDLAMLDANRWYRAKDFDRSIDSYQQALALRSTDFNARDGLTLAHVAATHGGIADHDRRAIEIAAGTLQMVPARSIAWAMTQNHLGLAWYYLPTGNKSENLQNAITAYNAALSVCTRTANPGNWAAIQNNLGNALSDLPTGNRVENLQKAIVAYDASLTVRTKEADPLGWAMTKNNLSVSWRDLPTGDRTENLNKAIAASSAALTVFDKESNANEWAMSQNNLGIAWSSVPTGDQAANLTKAITAWNAALTVYTKESNPAAWATTQNNLGTAWDTMPTGNRADNVQKAIDAYKACLTVRTKESDPVKWAGTQDNLATAWCDLPVGNKTENLQNAINGYIAALTVRTRDADPANWAATESNLGAAWDMFPGGIKSESLQKAITAYEAALTVRTKETDPGGWAGTQINMGNVWSDEALGNSAQNMHKAIAAYNAALTVFTKEADPVDWATAQNCLGGAWDKVPSGDKQENTRNALAAYQSALTVRTRNSDPFNWAATQFNLAQLWKDRLADDPVRNLSSAIACCKAAAQIPDFVSQYHELIETNLAELKKKYASTPAAATRPFDSIAPAE